MGEVILKLKTYGSIVSCFCSCERCCVAHPPAAGCYAMYMGSLEQDSTRKFIMTSLHRNPKGCVCVCMLCQKYLSSAH